MCTFYPVCPDPSSRTLFPHSDPNFPVSHKQGTPRACPRTAAASDVIARHLSLPAVKYSECRCWIKAGGSWEQRSGEEMLGPAGGRMPPSTYISWASAVSLDLWPLFSRVPQNFPKVFSLHPYPAIAPAAEVRRRSRSGSETGGPPTLGPAPWGSASGPSGHLVWSLWGWRAFTLYFAGI